MLQQARHGRNTLPAIFRGVHPGPGPSAATRGHMVQCTPGSALARRANAHDSAGRYRHGGAVWASRASSQVAAGRGDPAMQIASSVAGPAAGAHRAVTAPSASSDHRRRPAQEFAGAGRQRDEEVRVLLGTSPSTGLAAPIPSPPRLGARMSTRNMLAPSWAALK